MPIITVANLAKSYGSTRAVQDISFEVERGEIFGILGPNGSGKTTTIECLAGLRTADAGSMRVLEIDPQAEPEAIRSLVGIQLQESRLPAKLRVAEALQLYAAFYPNPADPDMLLDRLGLTSKHKTAFEDLSGGQKQRLSVALALVGNPQIAILDELTTGLDPQARREVWDLIEGIRDSGVTIVLVSHFMDEAERLCDRLIVIDEGLVVAEVTPRDLANAGVTGRSFRMRLPDPADARDLTALPEVTSVHMIGDEIEVVGSRTVLPAVLAALHTNGIVPDEVRTISRTLEDAYVDLVGAHTME